MVVTLSSKSCRNSSAVISRWSGARSRKWGALMDRHNRLTDNCEMPEGLTFALSEVAMAALSMQQSALNHGFEERAWRMTEQNSPRRSASTGMLAYQCCSRSTSPVHSVETSPAPHKSIPCVWNAMVIADVGDWCLRYALNSLWQAQNYIMKTSAIVHQFWCFKLAGH